MAERRRSAAIIASFPIFINVSDLGFVFLIGFFAGVLLESWLHARFLHRKMDIVKL